MVYPSSNTLIIRALRMHIVRCTMPEALPVRRVEAQPATGLAAAGIAIACLWYLDALTTAWALERGAVELGPLMRHVVERGMLAVIALKAVGLGAILALAWRYQGHGRPGTAHWGLAAVGCLSLAVVLWNLLSILLLQGLL